MFKSVSVESKSANEIAVMREAGAIVGDTLALLKSKVAPGITTAELDAIAEANIRKLGAKPAFLGYRGCLGGRCCC